MCASRRSSAPACARCTSGMCGLLRLGCLDAIALRLCRRKPSVHPLSALQRRDPGPGTRPVCRVGGSTVGPLFVMGAVVARDGFSTPPRRAHGLRRAGGDRPRTLRSTGAALALRALRNGDHRGNSPQVFSDLSEDTWLLYADGHGSNAGAFRFSTWESFEAQPQPPPGTQVSLEEWRQWDCRLRPMLLPADARNAYRQIADGNKAQRLGQIARLGIGYVSGDNGFFHLRPSDAERLDLAAYLRPSVTSGRQLHDGAIDPATVDRWRSEDRATFLVHVGPNSMISDALADYLASDAATIAQSRYKCRVRSPWYAVPNVTTPDMFLAYMSTDSPALARNDAGCVCSNAVHAVRLHANVAPEQVLERWGTSLTRLSCELEGHPLGGGLLKLEPREAARVLLAPSEGSGNEEQWRASINTMRRWRHRA